MIYRPYTNNNAVPGNSGSGNMNQPAPSTSVLGSFLSRLPYAYQILDAIIQRNPKYDEFKNVASRKEEFIHGQSVFLQQSEDVNSIGLPNNVLINKDYQAFVYANVDKDKARRLMDYRRMAAYAEIADCLDEICDECIVKDENDNVATFQLRGEYSKETKDLINKEFKKFIQIFDLEDNGWEYFRRFLVDGELFFENIIDSKRPELGIIGLVDLPSELINPVYQNVQNEIVKGFLLRKPTIDTNIVANKKEEEQLIFLQSSQISYIHSGIWNEVKTIRIPYLENCKRAYRILSLIEDSIVIYRLVRAPERLKFKIFTGNMSPPKAEGYVKRIMQQYWSKKNFDPAQNRVTNVYDPQSMLDSYFFAKDSQGNGHDVETIASGGNLGEIKDLDYFLIKLYKTLKIPASRFMTADNVFKDGAEITRDELRFARFIIRLQRQFAVGIRNSFVVHLKLKGLWKQNKLREGAIQVDFNIPTTFMAMREQQMVKMKFESFQSATQNQSISPSYAMKYYLGLSDEQMRENRDWLRRDAALEWEIGKIKEGGPQFRQQALQQPSDTGSGEEPSGGIGELGSDMPAAGGDSIPPDFGSAPAPTGGDSGGEIAAPTEPTPASSE
jgi:hypothetical protein